MKRDEVAETAKSLLSYLQEHVRTLVYVAVGLVVVAIAVAILFAYRDRQSRRGNEMLAGALRIHNAPIDTASPAPDDPDDPTFADEAGRNQRARAAFEEVRAAYGGHALGSVASSYLGDLAAAEGDLEAAEAHWRDALAKADDTLLAGRLQLNLINLLRSRGDGEQAERELRSLLASGESLPIDVILFELAKTLESLDRPDEAGATYQRLIDEYGSSIFSAEARRKLDEL